MYFAEWLPVIFGECWCRRGRSFSTQAPPCFSPFFSMKDTKLGSIACSQWNQSGYLRGKTSPMCCLLHCTSFLWESSACSAASKEHLVLTFSGGHKTWPLVLLIGSQQIHRLHVQCYFFFFCLGHCDGEWECSPIHHISIHWSHSCNSLGERDKTTSTYLFLMASIVKNGCWSPTLSWEETSNGGPSWARWVMWVLSCMPYQRWCGKMRCSGFWRGSLPRAPGLHYNMNCLSIGGSPIN